MNKSRKELGKQMNTGVGKEKIVETVIHNKCENVLDLGAGSCAIANAIASKGINVTAVDINFNDYDFDFVDGVSYISDDLCSFAASGKMVYGRPYDCVILSGVLHELSLEQLNKLAVDLNKIISDNAITIIREPIYEQYKDESGEIFFAPFKSYDAMVNCFMVIKDSLPSDFRKTFNRTKKLCDVTLPTPIRALNRVFTYSYGKESWDREMKEYRFTFKKSEIEHFVSKTFNSIDFDSDYINYFDTAYYSYFKKMDLDEAILESIYYTNTFMVFKKRV